MLGPAELREIHEALARADVEPAPPGTRGATLAMAFAAAVGVARALRVAGLTQRPPAPPPADPPPRGGDGG